MKFKAFIENGTKELEIEFEIDDDVAAHARLTEAIGKIQKLGKKPERAAAKSTDAPRTTPPGTAGIGGGK